MKLRILAVIACAALLYACNPVTEPTPPPTINVCGGNGSCGGNQGNTGPGGPVASPSPGPGQIATVGVHFFGTQVCRTGVTPSSERRTVRVGCTQAITCTPRLADGRDAGNVPGSHPPAPDKFEATSGNSFARLETSAASSYNRDAVALTAGGPMRIVCVVNGISSETSDPFDLVVVP